jgi:uncharacterized membrane protein
MAAPPRVREKRQAAAEQPAAGPHPMEIGISAVLRTGVLLAGAIILVGIVLFVARGGSGTGPHGLRALLGRDAASVHPGSVLRGVAAGNAVAIIQLGVFVLILTPVARVAMTVVLFAAQRDWIFVAITVAVFLMLVLGLTGVVG